MNTKVERLERDSRKRNLILFGISEEFNNYWDLEKFVYSLLNEKLDLNLNESHLDFVRRLGRRSGNNPRPILVGFTQLRTKLIILKNTSKLKGASIRITEDFSKEVIQTRKLLLPKLFEARKNGKFAILRHDKLIVQDINLSSDKQIAASVKKRALSDSPLAEKISTPKNSNLKKTKSNNETSESARRKLQQFSFSSKVPRSGSEGNISNCSESGRSTTDEMP